MPTTFDWSQTISSLPIPAEWLTTQGKDVKVAFVDTGVNFGLPSLVHLNKAGHKFFAGADGFSVAKLTGQDLVGEAFGVAGLGHGTLYASLLAGKSPDPVPLDRDLVTGIANAANYYIIKATDETGEVTTIKHLLDALELSANLGIEIFITGQCISRSEMQFEGLTDAGIDRVFNIPAVKKIFIFAPLKNRTTVAAWTGLTTDNFPSHHPHVFNVAKLPEVYGQITDVVKAQNIPFLLSGFEGELLSKTGKSCKMDFSNSGAAAIMGGIATLALSFFKQENGGRLPDIEQFSQLLAVCCSSLDDALGPFETPIIFKNFLTPAIS
jgi:subtilisin family serine protease